MTEQSETPKTDSGWRSVPVIERLEWLLEQPVTNFGIQYEGGWTNYPLHETVTAALAELRAAQAELARLRGPSETADELERMRQEANDNPDTVRIEELNYVLEDAIAVVRQRDSELARLKMPSAGVDQLEAELNAVNGELTYRPEKYLRDLCVQAIAAIRQRDAEIAALKHDIERHPKIVAELEGKV